MLSSKELFIKAFMEAECIKYADYQNEDDFDVEFSDVFKRKMEKLISKDNRIKMSIRRKFTKSLLAAVIAAIVMFTGLMSVSASRKNIIEFVENINAKYVDIELSDESQPTVDIIETAYTLSNLPEGYTQTSYQQDDASVTAVWNNKEGKKIIFDQGVLTSQMAIDNEHYYKKSVVNGKAVYFTRFYDLNTLIWYDDFYIYDINSDELDYDELVELSKNLVKK